MKIKRSILRDESAQAMTEFVIVVPVILLVFFVCFQIVMVWQAYLMTGYAAFAATRAASTYDQAIGTPAAQQMAKNAAALALMPVSRPVEGEIDFYSSRCNAGGAGGIRSFLQYQCGFKQHLLDKLPPIYNRVSGHSNTSASNDEKLQWLFTAWNRLHYNTQAPLRQSYGKQSVFAQKMPLLAGVVSDKLDDLGGGGGIVEDIGDKIEEEMTSASDLTEINVELWYDYPLLIPGFASLWDMMAGPKMGDIFTEKSPSILYYFYTMKSRCAIGYETFYRDFENTGEQGNENADMLKQLDTERISALQQEIAATTALLNSLKAQLAQCASQYNSMGYNSSAACTASITAQIKQTEARLKDLSQQMEDLTHL